MARKQKQLKDYMKEASQAHCDLNIFYGVIAILEGGTVSADSDTHVQYIIATCKQASAKCLRRMDAAVNEATRRYGGSVS